MPCNIKKSWLKAETEHTGNKKEQNKIVHDHLREFGCSYYLALFKMEKRLKGGGK